MPELPEVETVKRQLDERLRGRTITHISLWRSGREQPAGKKFVARLINRRVLGIDRRAKLLVWRLSGRPRDETFVMCHLKMTGRYFFVESDYARQKHDRLRFVFDDGQQLVWSDMRQFGFMQAVDAANLQRVLDHYGPEPLEHEAAFLAQRFQQPKKRRLKVALLDQRVIAGVGNIYADEACHRAGLRPTRRLESLALADRLRLMTQLQSVLRAALAERGTTANNYLDTRGERGGFVDRLRVYGRAGEPCQTCGTSIKRIVVTQRGTHYCPACQK